MTKKEATGHLRGEARRIAEAIFNVAAVENDERGEKTLYTGGCTPFFSPKDWKARGERYGGDSKLVIVYDGGDLYEFFGSYATFPTLVDTMREALAKLGVYHEAATGWYGAVYEA